MRHRAKFCIDMYLPYGILYRRAAEQMTKWNGALKRSSIGRKSFFSRSLVVAIYYNSFVCKRATCNFGQHMSTVTRITVSLIVVRRHSLRHRVKFWINMNPPHGIVLYRISATSGMKYTEWRFGFLAVNKISLFQ